MGIDFDPTKDQINKRKHGMSLAVAADFVLEQALVEPSDRPEQGERRYTAIQNVQGRILTLVFTWSGARLRAISLRPASRIERRRYDQTL